VIQQVSIKTYLGNAINYKNLSEAGEIRIENFYESDKNFGN